MVKNNFIWVGERLWLDAVNSEFIGVGARVDGWSDAALCDWLRQCAAHHDEAAALAEFADAAADAELLKRARELRASLRALCEALLMGESLDVSAINAALRCASVETRLEWNADGWCERESWGGQGETALWILARSAARSLAAGELARLKPCDNPSCILWFLDVSKNGKRRWCSMEGCGNRHKVAAHHRRRKQKEADE